MRVVFAGTPRVAVPTLDALLRSAHEVAAVVTRPDAPAGRGLHLAPSPVAERAAEAGLEVLKPARPRDPDFLDRLRAIGPDCCPVTAYGALIPQAALDIPANGWTSSTARNSVIIAFRLRCSAKTRMMYTGSSPASRNSDFRRRIICATLTSSSDTS